MAEPSTETLERIATTAERLRRVLADFADRTAEERCQYLAEELRRALSGIDLAQHPAFLEELRTHFGTNDGSVDLIEAEALLGAPCQFPPDDVASLVSRLVDLSAQLMPHERQQIAEHLGQAGLVLEPAWDMQAIQALREALQMRSGDSLDPNRLIDLARLLTSFTSTLHQFTWSTWRALASQSGIRRAGNLQKMLARFAGGAADISADQLQAELDRLRQLMASLISAVGQVGRQFATSFLAKLTPGEILSVVCSESHRHWWNSGRHDSLCWRKYVELSELLEQSAVESEIRKTIVSNTEQLMKKLGHA